MKNGGLKKKQREIGLNCKKKKKWKIRKIKTRKSWRRGLNRI